MAEYQEFNGLISPQTNLLRYIQKGVLWVNDEPLYMIELIKEQDLSYVMVYRVHPGTKKFPKKLAVEVATKDNKFGTTTKLGQLANALIPSKTVKKWVPRDPLFVAPVIPNGISTFTGKREPGFFERDEDRIAVEGGKKKMIRGNNTGVFVGLSSIIWEEKFTIPTDSLVKTLTQYKEDMFFDLEGNNTNLDNPLSSYYKEGKMD